MDEKDLIQKLRIIIGIEDLRVAQKMAYIFLREFRVLLKRGFTEPLREKVLVYTTENSLYIHGIYYTGKGRFWMEQNIKCWRFINHHLSE